MKSARELSPELAARLSRAPVGVSRVPPTDELSGAQIRASMLNGRRGEEGGAPDRPAKQDAADSVTGGERRGGSDYSKLRGIIRSQKDQIQVLEHQVTHFQSRAHHIEDGHKLELARLKKEVEYHKRLRQGADQRSYELEDRLGRLSLHQHAAASRHPDHDEEKDGLIAQSQLLISKNSELSTRVKMLESQVPQLEELKSALERELNQAYCERDDLATELERILSKQHGHHHHHSEAAADVEGYGEEGNKSGGSHGSALADGDAAGQHHAE